MDHQKRKEEQNQSVPSQDHVDQADLDRAKENAAKNDASRSSRRRKSSSAFRTISEVSDDLGVQQHVLRFWETKFSQVKPLKRGGGRRYYRPEDVKLLKAIHRLLYIEGYTIKGVQKLFREAGKSVIVENFSTPDAQSPILQETKTDDDDQAVGSKLTEGQKRALEDVLAELKELRGMIKKS